MGRFVFYQQKRTKSASIAEKRKELFSSPNQLNNSILILQFTAGF